MGGFLHTTNRYALKVRRGGCRVDTWDQDRDGRVQVDIGNLGQRRQGLGGYIGSRIEMVGFRQICQIKVEMVQGLGGYMGSRVQMVGFRWMYGIQGINGRVQVDIQNLGYRQGSSGYIGYLWYIDGRVQVDIWDLGYRWQGSGGYIESRVQIGFKQI